MIRVLIDENLSKYFAEGLNIMQSAMGNGIEVVSVETAFGVGAQDEDWIPALGKQKGIVITQDINITRSRHLAELLLESKVGAFFLSVPKNYKYWDKSRLIVNKWEEIVQIILKSKPPFAYVITPRKMEKLKF